jgi:hypothetical protein
MDEREVKLGDVRLELYRDELAGVRRSSSGSGSGSNR